MAVHPLHVTQPDSPVTDMTSLALFLLAKLFPRPSSASWLVCVPAELHGGGDASSPPSSLLSLRLPVCLLCNFPYTIPYPASSAPSCRDHLTQLPAFPAAPHSQLTPEYHTEAFSLLMLFHHETLLSFWPIYNANVGLVSWIHFPCLPGTFPTI